MPYEIAEQATPTLAIPTVIPTSAKELTFDFATTTGVAKSTTLPVQR